MDKERTDICNLRKCYQNWLIDSKSIDTNTNTEHALILGQIYQQ